MNPVYGLLSIALGSFAIGTTEFAPIGLLPLIESCFHLSEAAAGMMITVYAVGVMVGAPFVILCLRSVARNRLLVCLMAIFVAGNVMAGFAWNYSVLLFARVVTSLAHAAFFGVGALVAASLVPHGREARAVASIFTGMTVASIIGVPGMTSLGNFLGWRATFLVTAGVGGAAALCLAVTLPWRPVRHVVQVGREISNLFRSEVMLSLVTTSLGSTAMFTFFTYFASLMQHKVHASPGLISGSLFLVGIGFTVGNSLGGRLAEFNVTRTALGALAGMALMSIIFTLVTGTLIFLEGVIFLWAVCAFALIPPMQLRIMAAAAEAPDLASSVNIGAFNLGNALGALLGGGLLHYGVSETWLPGAGACVALCNIALISFMKPNQTKKA